MTEWKRVWNEPSGSLHRSDVKKTSKKDRTPRHKHRSNPSELWHYHARVDQGDGDQRHVRTASLQEGDAHEPLLAYRITSPPYPEARNHQHTRTASESDKLARPPGGVATKSAQSAAEYASKRLSKKSQMRGNRKITSPQPTCFYKKYRTPTD